MKTVLVVGGGAREHALAWKLSRSPQVSRVIVAPGNEAMGFECWSDVSLNSQSGFEALATRALAEKVNLAVIGPDNPLADGIVDLFEKHKISTFGPSAAAARIESSKSFAKDVMKTAGVPTARFFVANGIEDTKNILKGLTWVTPWVLKADGLALGKGVEICATYEIALQAADRLIKVSPRLVIEEFIEGEEVSWLAFCEGESFSLLEPARDFKRLGDGQTGPNTGGMGAYSPVVEVMKPDYEALVREKVFAPTLREMKKRGCAFKGVLYAGLMVNFKTGKIWVLEFNARFGDPETQALMPRMKGDAYDWFASVAENRLSKMPSSVPFNAEASVYVVAAAPGYPDNPKKDLIINGLGALSGGLNQSDEYPEYFFGGLKKQGSRWMTQGGRVLGALGLASTMVEARKRAYDHLSRVSFEGMQFRKDIAAI